MDTLLSLFGVGAIIAVASFAFSRRGKELMFGGTIVKTIGDTPSSKRRLASTGIKVHVIHVAPGVRNVGLEISHATGLSYQMIPVSLTVENAKELAEMLNEAASSP